MLELRDRIATLIDESAIPVTLDDVRGVVRRRRVRRRVGFVLGALVVVVVVNALVSPSRSARPKIAIAATTQPPTDSATFGHLEIPALDLNVVVVSPATIAMQRLGPVHDPASGFPGIIIGHRTTYSHPFFDLDTLHRGDRVVVTTAQGTYRFHVESSRVVAPADLAAATPHDNRLLYLVTNTPKYSAAQRLVVTARLDGAH